MHAFSAVFSLLVSASVASAADIWVQVGGNTTNNASLVYIPQEIHANLNDTVLFNFTQGNHTAIQSTFAQPCLPSDESIDPINGFDSSFRNAGNFTNVSILAVPLLEQNYNLTMWFYDSNTCGQGGVGVINPNDSSTQTLEGFIRNAIRLNGTSTSSSASPSSTAHGGSGSSSSSSSSPSNTPNSGSRSAILGGLAALPLVVAAFALQ